MYWAIPRGVGVDRAPHYRPFADRFGECPRRPRTEAAVPRPVVLISGPEIAAYGFPEPHPFGADRHDAFIAELERSDCYARLVHKRARQAERNEIELFHTSAYVERVMALSRTGEGLLDMGDTPAYRGVYEAAANVVGGTLEALAAIVAGPVRTAFIPIGGLH